MSKSTHLLFVLAAGLILFGCENKDDDSTTVLASDNSSVATLKPTGTISGKVVDRHTEKPVNGAVVSIAFNGSVTSTTTDISGSFSFANVPCNRDATTGLSTGTYQLTVSLVEVNKAIPDSLPKYREYYFNNALNVTFIDLPKNDSTSNKYPTEGLEANIRFDVAKLNTTITGYVVDEKMEPVAQATVWLHEWATGDVIQQTTADANGMYQFFKVEDGSSLFIDAKSPDNLLEGTLNNVLNLTINRASETLRPQVFAEQIMLLAADNVSPYVTMISPENLSDVAPAGLQIVYKFSEPIKQTPYTVTNAPLGLGTLIDDIHVNFLGLKKTSGNTNFNLSWDASFTTLTVAPAEIVGSSRYQVDISAALAKLTDRAGNNVAASPVIGDFEPLNFTTNGSTAVPAAPVLARRLNSGLGFVPLDFAGGVVGFEWNFDVNARNYRLYRSINNEPFVLVADNIQDTRYSDNSGVLVTGYNPPVDRDPFTAYSVRYKVRGVSKDLVEGPESNILTVKDDVAPQVVGATIDSSAGITGGDYIFLQFDEPLTTPTAQTAGNFSVINSGGGLNSAVSEVVYLGYDNISFTYRVRVTVTKHSIDANDVIIANPGIIDLAGNAVDSGKNSFTF